MRTDIDWKGIAPCWETLVKENQELHQIIIEQDHIIGILRKHAKFIDSNYLLCDKPVPNCDIAIVVKNEDPDNEIIKKWLEGNK